MTQTESEHQEPQTFCDSCWFYDDIRNSWFEEVMYCRYHGEAYEDYEICDEYEDAARLEDALTKMKSEDS